VPAFSGDLRPTLEAHFARRAKIELPARTWELAAVTGVDVKHVTVRNQRSRWGSWFRERHDLAQLAAGADAGFCA